MSAVGRALFRTSGLGIVEREWPALDICYRRTIEVKQAREDDGWRVERRKIWVVWRNNGPGQVATRSVETGGDLRHSKPHDRRRPRESRREGASPGQDGPSRRDV